MFFIIIILIILVLANATDSKNSFSGKESLLLLFWIGIGVLTGAFLVVKGHSTLAIIVSVSVASIGVIMSNK